MSWKVRQSGTNFPIFHSYGGAPGCAGLKSEPSVGPPDCRRPEELRSGHWTLVLPLSSRDHTNSTAGRNKNQTLILKNVHSKTPVLSLTSSLFSISMTRSVASTSRGVKMCCSWSSVKGGGASSWDVILQLWLHTVWHTHSSRVQSPPRCARTCTTNMSEIKIIQNSHKINSFVSYHRSAKMWSGKFKGIHWRVSVYLQVDCWGKASSFHTSFPRGIKSNYCTEAESSRGITHTLLSLFYLSFPFSPPVLPDQRDRGCLLTYVWMRVASWSEVQWKPERNTKGRTGCSWVKQKLFFSKHQSPTLIIFWLNRF